VILSPNIGLADTMLVADAGVLVPDTPRAFGELINQLTLNPEVLDRMGHNGLNLVKERYSWGTRALELVSVYERYRYKAND